MTTPLRIGSPDGVEVDVLGLGATVQSIWVAGPDGERRDVALGHASLEEYRSGTAFLGATIGRYANRIAGGRTVLDGTPLRLPPNDGAHHLHGGPEGFHAQTWTTQHHDPQRLVLTHRSPAGHAGYPGELRVRVTMTTDGDTFRIEHEAETDASTLVNLTNHGYLNLAGDVAGRTVHDHRLRVPAARYTPVDDDGIPLGEHADVTGTRFDLRAGVRLGDVEELDHNLLPEGVGLREVAELSGHGLIATLSSDQPGLQVYTGRFLDGTTTSRAGHPILRNGGVALEPQLPPDTPNRPAFGSAVLRPGETYRHTLSWRFARG